MKLKVIEFITNLSDGGVENLVKDYAVLIDKDQFDICVVTIRNFNTTAVYNELKEHHIRMISVYPRWNLIIKIFNKIFGYYYINWRLKSILKKKKANVVHAHLYTLKYLHRIKRNLRNIRFFIHAIAFRRCTSMKCKVFMQKSCTTIMLCVLLLFTMICVKKSMNY